MNPFDILRQRDWDLLFSYNAPIDSPRLPVSTLNFQFLQSSKLEQVCGILYGSCPIRGGQAFFDGLYEIRGHNNRAPRSNIGRMSDAAFSSDHQSFIER
jgi:hypothetical protein